MDQKENRRTRRKAERPTEILDAAFEEFVKNSEDAATRLEDVAKRAGVTKGTIYFYFETKERVFDEMVRHVSRSIFQDVPDFAKTLEGTSTARLRAFLEFVFGTIAGNRTSRETLRFLIAEGTRFPDLVDRHFEEFVQPILDQIQSLIKAGIASGEFRKGPAAEIASIAVSPALLLSVWTLLFGDRKYIDAGALTSASFDVLLNGLTRNDALS